MSTAAAAAQTALSYPAFAWGPVKVQIMDIGIVSGDTGATATATNLSAVDYAILIANVRQSAVPTYSSNVATFTFADPVATVKGHVILFGK
jgi:hypothetical protein